jgi:type II secretion system protein D
MPPANQQPAAPQGGADEFRSPRRPLNFSALTELGTGVITGDPHDIEELLKLIEYLQKNAAGTLPIIEVVPLKFADPTSVTNILTQVFQRFVFTPSGAVLIGGANRPNQPATNPFGQANQQAAVIQQPNNLMMIPLPRFNAIMVVAARDRVPEIKREIDKLDTPTAANARPTAFPLKKASAQTVANFLTQLYQTRYPSEPTTQNQVRITSDSSTNTVFVQASPGDMQEIKGLIDQLDSSVSAAVNDVRVLKLRNALADEMTNTIMTAISQGVVAPTTTPGAPTTPGLLPGAVRPGTTTAPSAAGTTTKTTSLRLFGPPGTGGSVEAGVLEDVHITADIRSNSLIISAPTRTMNLIIALVQQLDQPAAAQAAVNIFKLKKADAVQTANLLTQMFTGTATARPATAGAPTFTPAAPAAAPGGGRQLLLVGGQPSDGAALISLSISVDDRTNSLIVAGSRNDLDVIQAVIARLEDDEVESRHNTVVRIKNQAAADVATALQTFITNNLTVYSTGGVLSSFQEVQRNIVIVAEPISNTILVSATPRYFAEILSIIEKIDAMPPQVVIQVLIAEVTLNDNQEFGAEFGLQSPVEFLRGILPGTVANSTTPTFAVPGFNFNTTNPVLPNSSPVNPQTVGFQGISNLGVGRVSPTSGVGGFVFSASSDSLSILVRALKAQGRLDVLSRPQVTCLDNQTAAVNIGQDFPIVGDTTITTGLATTSVLRRNIGVLLRVTPRITPDGKVLMRVFPEVSSVGQLVQLSTNVFSQAFNVQQVETTVVGQDNETVIIGGLIAQKDQKTETKVPYFGDLPYIGAAFRYRTQVRQKTELLVILTPHIVRSQDDMDKVLCEEARRMNWIISDIKKIHATTDVGTSPGNESPAPMIFPGNGGMVTDGSFIPGLPPPPPATAPGPVTPPIPSGAPMPSGPPVNGVVIPPVTPSSAATTTTGPALMPADLRNTPDVPQSESTSGKEPRQWIIPRG